MAICAGQTAFYYLAFASVASAMLAVTRKNPVHSMLWVLALFHVAGIFLLLGAEFLAAVQVIVYAGAILVFYLFFLMLLDLFNVSLAAFSHHLQDARGQVMALFVIAVAAAEAAVGLGLVLALSRHRRGISFEDMAELTRRAGFLFDRCA